MGRRVELPAADDLFRSTKGELQASSVRRTEVASEPDAETVGERQPSGRVRHDEKMTVYVTADELLSIEHARLSLRSRHGLVVDRGRLVREAVAMVLADLEAAGEDSRLVKRLTDR